MHYLCDKGFFLKPHSHQGMVTIGGKCELPGAISPNDQRPLVQHAAIRLGRGDLAIPGWQSLDVHLLYSWKCDIHMHDFSYRDTDQRIEIVEFGHGASDHEGFPYVGYPSSFPPVPCELVQISKSDQMIISKLNASAFTNPDYKYSTIGAEELAQPRHQFGGEPFLLDPNAHEKHCPVCKNEMLLFASIANDNYSDSDGFFGNDFVQILYWICSSCQIVSARNYAD